MVVDLLHLTIM